MSATGKARLLACALALALGCDSKLLIGRNCPGGDCDRAPASDAAVAYSAEFVMPPAIVLGEEKYRCQLFTLDGLHDAADSDRAYITKAVATMLPYVHEIEVRIAPEDLDVADGPVDCDTIRDLPVRWVPLIADQSEREEWDFEGAEITASRAQRLLIIDHFFNSYADPITVAVTLQLECAGEKPPRPSETFEFIDGDSHVVGPAEQLTVSGSCTFGREVDVWRLFRPTQRISKFTVRRNQTRSIWDEDDDTIWSTLLAPPLRVSKHDTLQWSCGYRNQDDTSFTIGGDSGYACALMGMYQPVHEGEDAEPLRCTSHQ